MPAYAELQVTSNFSFLRGASHPEELVRAGAGAGPRRASRSPIATAWPASSAPTQQAKEVGIRFLVGCRLDLSRGDGTSLLCWPDRPAGLCAGSARS